LGAEETHSPEGAADLWIRDKFDMADDSDSEPVRSTRRRPTFAVPTAQASPGVTAMPQESRVDWLRLLSLPTLLQPKPFTGQKKDFPAFRRDVETSLLPLGIEHLLHAAVTEPQEPALQTMTDSQKECARLLDSILTKLVRDTGQAELILESVVDKNGFAAWRKLVRDLGRVQNVDHQTAVYASLLNPEWTDDNWEAQWLAWEVAIARYTLDTGKQVDGETKTATVVWCAPPRVQDFLKMCPRELTSSYAILQSALLNFLACKTAAYAG